MVSPLGQYILQMESRWFFKTLENQFGFTAIQFGSSEVNLLASCKIRQRILAGQGPTVHIVADPLNMPFATNSVDVLVLPHLLDFTIDPHQVLREAQRVLIPEGRILISGFNPASLWGGRRFIGRDAMPWSGNFISLPRVKDWLSLLNFKIRSSETGGYIPPCAQPKWQTRFHFMEAAGGKWWSGLGAVYFIEATKKVYSMRLTGVVQRQLAKHKRPSRLKLVAGRDDFRLDQETIPPVQEPLES